jgi:proteasome assembly chaperone (PAC2) family protein
MDAVRWQRRPTLRRPVLVAAFEGWNDAGDGASGAAAYLADAWEAEPFAAIDPEEFYDFTLARPEVRMEGGVTRRIDWPDPKFSVATPPGGDHDIVFLQAFEPQLRWRSYASTVVGVATTVGVELVVTLGALLAEVPHTRPVRVTGTAGSSELVERLHLRRSRYEGPTGIVGVLHDAFARSGIPSASLWAAVPHYVAKTPSPKATLALVERAASLLGAPVDTIHLEIAAAAYERQVSEVVADDEDVADYVRRLEDDDFGLDEAIGEDIEGADEGDVGVMEADDLPSAESLAGEVERFLRDQRGD